MSDHRIVALDGPSAAGKFTVARGVAQELGWLYGFRCFIPCDYMAIINKRRGAVDEPITQEKLQQMEWSFWRRCGCL